MQDEVVRHPYGMATVLHLFRNNATLCAGISERVVTHTFKSIERQGRQETFLQFLRSVIKVNDVVQRYRQGAPDALAHPSTATEPSSVRRGGASRKTQEVILSSLMMAGPNVLLFYSDDVAFETLITLMKSMDEVTRVKKMDLSYHIELIHLIADCAEVRGPSFRLIARASRRTTALYRTPASPRPANPPCQRAPPPAFPPLVSCASAPSWFLADCLVLACRARTRSRR